MGDISPARLEWYFGVAAALRVAEVEGRLAGFLLALRPGLDYASPNYRWFSRRYADFYYVDRLAVDPTWRRRGVAAALYADAERAARAAGAPVIACEVNLRPRNDASLAFHAAQGFEEVGRQDSEDGASTVAMLVRAVDATPGEPDAGPARGA
ncbi:MAG: GNAT family N-acetyltransferase [Halofilum sp. (in: g-proteobacteria)]|nr:GNAT family N-acetyltransferase [Halofilum sp. (in: g-proteobacteria)]